MNSRTRMLAVMCGAVACLATGVLAAPAQAAEPAWSAIAASGPTVLAPVQSEVQKVAVDAEEGSFTLSFGGKTTEPLAFDVAPFGGEAPNESVQKALEALPSVGAGDVSVTGGPGGPGAEHPYVVAFEGSLAGQDLPLLVAGSGGLSGGNNHTATVFTSVPGGPGITEIALYAQNVGGAASSGQITLSFTLPEGVTTSATPQGTDVGSGGWSCLPAGAGQSAVTCTSTASVGPGLAAQSILAPVIAGPSAAGTKPVEITVSGGGAAEADTYSMPLTVSETPAGPGFQSFNAGAYDENGKLDTRAGGHPYSAGTAILVNTKRTRFGDVVPVGEFKDIMAELPPGFLGNPIATPQCPEAQKHCPQKTILGTVQTPLRGFGGTGSANAVYNVQAPFGYPGKFKFEPAAGAITINVVASLRSDEDYGLEAGAPNIPQVFPVYGTFFTFWGAPNSSSHDGQRCEHLEPLPESCEAASGKNIAFLTNATNCAEEALSPPIVTLNVDLWQFPGQLFSSGIEIPPVTGCDKLKFEAGFSFQPSETKADSPGAFTTNLTIPSEGLTDPEKLTTPEQKRIVVNLPQGVALNPSSADGLGACSEEQIGLRGTGFPAPNHIRFDKAPNQCPDSSKIGTMEVKSSLLEQTLHGAMYLAAQGEANPFGSLFAVYLVIEDPQTGIVVKLPGEVQPDASTGQIRAVFDDIPPLPFDFLKLNFKGGARSPLATPQTCGEYVTRTVNTPWSAPESGPPFETEDSFTIDQGANGAPCASSEAQLPFNLGFDAGTANPVAGAHSPFTMRLTRPDGAQSLSGLELSTPEGFSATLKGIPYCSDAQLAAAATNTGNKELASPSCSSASQVGSLTVGAGSGPNPFYVPGKVYLAGPYKGSQISLAAVVPAVAGPFDLGVQVVRVALHLDPRTAKLTAVSDPIPQILDGVPLRVRDVRVDVDRKDFTLNPTDCTAQQVSAKVTGSGGAVANLSNRFQVGGCDKLGFKPKLSLKLKGGTKRGGHPGLRATLTTRPGDANFASAAVTLPHSAFLDQAHIRTICTRVQFAANACPQGAVYGYAKAFTPLLDNPVEGPVYLRSSDNRLPDLVVDLGGQVDVEVVGRIDSVNGGIRNVFDVIPDAPVSKFELSLQGGKKGLVVNSRDLCTSTNKATVKFGAQNGLSYNFRTAVVPSNCKKAHKHHGKHKKHR